jgi:hypothetical protein
LRIKEQETLLILREHNDDDDDDIFYLGIYLESLKKECRVA